MKYKEVLPMSRKQAETAFSSELVMEICDALLSVTYYNPDWKWVQTQCIFFCKHSNSDIRGLAATCIGHLARIHSVLDIESAMMILHELLEDSEVSGRAQDALDDIKIFLLQR
jgi:hypothetical protein